MFHVNIWIRVILFLNYRYFQVLYGLIFFSFVIYFLRLTNDIFMNSGFIVYLTYPSLKGKTFYTPDNDSAALPFDKK